MSSRQLYRIVAPKREPIAHDRWRPGRGGVVLLSSVLADFFFFFFKQKTAYEIHSDWSSDVCSSDLLAALLVDAALLLRELLVQPLLELDVLFRRGLRLAFGFRLRRLDGDVGLLRRRRFRLHLQIGRASCRERG